MKLAIGIYEEGPIFVKSWEIERMLDFDKAFNAMLQKLPEIKQRMEEQCQQKAKHNES